MTHNILSLLSEIATAGKATFLQAGGVEFRHIPCLNDHPAYIDFLARRTATWRATLIGALGGNRTHDLSLTKGVLYH